MQELIRMSLRSLIAPIPHSGLSSPRKVKKDIGLWGSLSVVMSYVVVDMTPWHP